MPKKTDLVKIHGAAVYFAYVSRDIKEIAATFAVSDRTIRRWAARSPAWQEALDACGYDGVRAFETKPTRDPSREVSGLYIKARTQYRIAHQSGYPHHKLASIVARNIKGLTQRRVREWAKKYDWIQESDPIDVKIHGAAFYFAHVSQSAKELAEICNISEGTLLTWERRAAWNQALDVWRYNGKRAFEDVMPIPKLFDPRLPRPEREDPDESDIGEKEETTAVKIHGVAFFFVHISQYADQISEICAIPIRTLLGWENREEWTHALNVWEHTGDHTLKGISYHAP